MPHRAASAAASVLVLAFVFGGAGTATAQTATSATNATGVAGLQQHRAALADSDLRVAIIRAAAALKDGEADERTALLNHYSCSAAAPLWVSGAGPTAAAAALLSELDKADEWGLAAKDFKVDANLEESASPDARAGYELKLSRAALKYARHARGGRISDPAVQLASYLDRKPALVEPEAVLQSLAATSAPDAYLRGLNPQHPQFEKLRQEYLKARGASVTAVRIPSGPGLRPGETHPHIALLRKRLAVPAADASSPEFYDAALADAVKKFQKEKGISSASGTLGSATRAELNDGIGETGNADRLLANMEMWRWMPRDLGTFRVEVNVPEFMVRVVKNDAVVHAERVVTGKKETQTPVFSDQMRTVVFQPQWGLPDSIKVNEVLPRLLAGDGLRSGYRMQRNGKDINPEKVDWEKASILDYHVFQPSGDDNALGQVKFLFPNKHQVYMHDTPSKGLFGEKVRTYSHGCVRVRNPVRLAEVVLAEDKGWSKEQVRVELEDKDENNKVALDRRVPVHITYFTASVDDAGKLQTFRDIYGHENRVTLALAGRWKEIPKLPDHLAPVTVANAQSAAKKLRQAADDEQPQRRSRSRVAAADDDWSQPRRGAAPPPPVRVYRAPPPSYGPRYSLGRGSSSYGPGPKSIFQQLFGGN
jgi:murein L,D-transpeptidase YcbB/YkuD